MKRRTFLQKAGLSSLILASGKVFSVEKTHIITFSFDDGFKKSFYRAAEIHEEYGSKACLNVIARGGMKDFKAVDKWILPELLGNFDDWNLLKSRGHEIMPHTWEHLNLTKIPLSKAKKNIDLCLNHFEKHLDGFKSEEAVFNFAFNASNEDLESYLLERVRAVRTGWWLVFDQERYHAVPLSSDLNVLACRMGGPDLIDEIVEEEVNQFLQSEGGWLIFNLHGFDTEGWGPISEKYYDNLLSRLSKIAKLEVLPTAAVLKSLSPRK